MCAECGKTLKQIKEEALRTMPDLNTPAGAMATVVVAQRFTGSLAEAVRFSLAFDKASRVTEARALEMIKTDPEGKRLREEANKTLAEMADEARELALMLRKLVNDIESGRASEGSTLATDEPADGAKILPFNNGDDKFLSDLGIG